ncbi:MAG: hypothetical protein IID03_12875, partial [Candidatus Dadabacteria bacterium]|nr:hypothetical protein [Candidatus Dadabacteria bacterium]
MKSKKSSKKVKGKATGKREHQYVVIIRGSSGVIFEEQQSFTVNQFLQDNKRVDLVFRTRYTKIKGVDGLIPRGIWIDARGSASSINEAINIFSNASLAIAGFFSFCVNAPIGDLEPEIAYDNTPKLKKREYFQQFLADERIRPYAGRLIDIKSTEKVLSSLMNHKHSERIHRALVHYTLAIKHWKYGQDTFSLAHIYMGIEALTPVALRKYLQDNNLTKDALISKWKIDKKQIDPEVRRRLLFKGDDICYKDSKAASD